MSVEPALARPVLHSSAGIELPGRPSQLESEVVASVEAADVLDESTEQLAVVGQQPAPHILSAQPPAAR